MEEGEEMCNKDAYVQSPAFDACDVLKVSEVRARYVKHHAQGLARGRLDAYICLSELAHARERKRERNANT